MGLESGEFLDDLVQANPVTATDPVSEGSDHIRLLKKVLQQSFGLMDGLLQFPTNDVWFKQSNAAADGFINMIKVNADDQVEIGSSIIASGDVSLTAGLFQFTGGISFPGSISTDGMARIYSSDTLGLVVYGLGTINNFSFVSPAGTAIMNSPVGTLDIVMARDLIVTGDLTVSTGLISVDSTTESTNTTTGSIHADGGLGVAKRLNVGGAVSIAGILTVDADVSITDGDLNIRQDGIDQFLINLSSDLGAAGVRSASIRTPKIDSTGTPFRFVTSNSWAFEVDGSERFKVNNGLITTTGTFECSGDITAFA